MINTMNLQKYIVLKSLDAPLPDSIAGSLNRLLPAFQINEVESEYVRGVDIPNGTYRQRIACNFLAPVKLWSSKEQCDAVINAPKVAYDPNDFNALGESIISAPTMVGNSYHLINFIIVEGVDDDLKTLRDAWKFATGLELHYPEGYAIDADARSIYFNTEIE